MTTAMPRIADQEWSRFYNLRTRIFDLIAYELSEDPHCKSYEGCMEIGIIFPDYFDEHPNAFKFGLMLHCYILIDGRHETYRGPTFKHCLDKLERDVVRWETERKDGMDEWRKRKEMNRF